MIRERDLAQEGEHQGDGQLRNTGRGGTWSIENSDSFLFRSLKVNIVEADTCTSDDLQFGISNQTGVNFCSASNYQRIILIDGASKFCLVYSRLVVYRETGV